MITKQAQSVAEAADDRHFGESGLFAKAQSLVSQALQHLRKESKEQQAIWELEQLDDRALRDIGISRSEIEAQVRGRRL
jgi:uncharacterized protein YjiS (DUF1127 family)